MTAFAVNNNFSIDLLRISTQNKWSLLIEHLRFRIYMCFMIYDLYALRLLKILCIFRAFDYLFAVKKSANYVKICNISASPIFEPNDGWLSSLKLLIESKLNRLKIIWKCFWSSKIDHNFFFFEQIEILWCITRNYSMRFFCDSI